MTLAILLQAAVLSADSSGGTRLAPDQFGPPNGGTRITYDQVIALGVTHAALDAARGVTSCDLVFGRFLVGLYLSGAPFNPLAPSIRCVNGQMWAYKPCPDELGTRVSLRQIRADWYGYDCNRLNRW